jgi:hypothetical protein
MNGRNGLLLGSLVIISSLLGISCAAIALGAGAYIGMAIVTVWRSPIADLVFITGTVGAAILGTRLCRWSYLAAVIVALVANAAVYAVAFIIVDRLVLGGSHNSVVGEASFAVVGGWPGLAFAALAPAALAYSRKPRPVGAVSDEKVERLPHRQEWW